LLNSVVCILQDKDCELRTRIRNYIVITFSEQLNLLWYWLLCLLALFIRWAKCPNFWIIWIF